MARSKSCRQGRAGQGESGPGGTGVCISSNRIHERSVLSPVGVQSLFRAVHSRLFCQTTLSMRLSPVSRLAGLPGWSAAGGKPGGDIGTVLTPTATGPGGVPTIVYTFMPVPVEVVVLEQNPTMITATVV